MGAHWTLVFCRASSSIMGVAHAAPAREPTRRALVVHIFLFSSRGNQSLKRQTLEFRPLYSCYVSSPDLGKAEGMSTLGMYMPSFPLEI